MSMLGPGQQPSYYQEPPNDITGGLPINLDSLRDGPPGSKPFYPYSTLIRYAIKGSPEQKLLLEDIYYAIESRFPYFRTAPGGWKNSVRHNLSLNPCFEKVPRPLTDRGKGSYWTVNDNVDPRTGVHRIRKKRNKSSQQASQQQSQQSQAVIQQQPQDVPDPAMASMEYHTSVEMQYPMFNPNAAQMPDRRPEQDHYPNMEVNQYIMASDPGLNFVDPHELRLDEHGQPDWRIMWHSELTKLKAFTHEQDKAGVSQEWYRMMLARMRGALVPIGPDGMPVPPGPPHGHPIDHDIPEDGDEVHDPELDQDQ